MKLPEENSGGSFELCPDGNHLAVCVRLIDLGTQDVVYEGTKKQQRKIYIEWEIPGELMEDGKPFCVGSRYTLSSHEKSTLRKHLESWRGRKFTAEDFGKFEIRNLLGKGCFIQVVHSEREGKNYANIQSVASLPKGVTAPQPVNDLVFFSMEEGEFDHSTFSSLSERIQDLIKKSPEYQVILRGKPEPVSKADPLQDFDSYESDEEEPPF